MVVQQVAEKPTNELRKVVSLYMANVVVVTSK